MALALQSPARAGPALVQPRRAVVNVRAAGIAPRPLVSLPALAPRPSLAAAPTQGGRAGSAKGGAAPLSPREALVAEIQREKLAAGTALRNIGWLLFWSQLTLTVVSALILLFSGGSWTPDGTLSISVLDATTLVGVVAGLVSTFLGWGYMRTGVKLGGLQDVKLNAVIKTVLRGTTLNLIGMGAAILGLQGTVGSLVGKTLASAAAGGYYARNAAPPPVAFDIFSVQATANIIMAHFCGIVLSNWLLRVLNGFVAKEEERAALYAPSAPPMPGY